MAQEFRNALTIDGSDLLYFKREDLLDYSEKAVYVVSSDGGFLYPKSEIYQHPNFSNSLGIRKSKIESSRDWTESNFKDSFLNPKVDKLIAEHKHI